MGIDKIKIVWIFLIAFCHLTWAQQAFVNNVRPDWSPDGKRIVFSSNRTGNYEIFTMDADGKNQVLLSKNGAKNLSPVWSPSGDFVAFSSNLNGGDDIFLMRSDGTESKQLTHIGTALNPSWSPDGQRIVFMSRLRSDRCALKIVDLKSLKVTQVVEVDDGTSPDWSPDGLNILYDDFDERRQNPEVRRKEWGLFFISPNGENKRAYSQNVREIYGKWSPDGQSITFSTARDGNYESYMGDIDGKSLKRMTNSLGRDYWMNWSSDMSKVIFSSNRGGNFDIYLMDVNSENLVQLTFQPEGEILTIIKKYGINKAERTYSRSKNLNLDTMLVDKRNIYDLAYAYILGKQFNKAKRLFMFLAQIYPKDSGHIRGLADMFYERKKIKLALKHYKEYVALNPHARDVNEVQDRINQLAAEQ